MRIIHCLPISLLAVTACVEGPPTGGVTAQIKFPERDIEAGKNTRTSGRGLRAKELPIQIGRLEILAIDSVSGSTLASTNLYTNPIEGQTRLEPAGGLWELDRVPIGTGRMIVGKAYLGADPDPRLSDLLLYRGRIADVEVKSGETTNAGTLQMFVVQGVRYPPFDLDPPSKPGTRPAVMVPEGESLQISWDRPPEEDVAGYLIAVGTDMQTPIIERNAMPIVGTILGGDIAVMRYLKSPIPETVTITGLENGKTYRVLVYAYDTDLGGNPLNWSMPGTVFGLPQDTVPPGAPLGLTAAPANGGLSIEFTFTAPGEDGAVGMPATYQVRASSLRAVVENEDTFELTRPVTPPAVRNGGEIVRFTRTWDELFVPVGTMYLGIRALDAFQTPGPIAVVEYVVTASGTPAITALEPPIAIAGGLMTIRGTDFGSSPGSVTLTSDDVPPLTYPVAVNNWANDEISVRLPNDARSGDLRLQRSGDSLSATSFLPVLARIDNAFEAYEAPFELISTRVDPPVGPTQTVAALYRERSVGVGYEGAIDRVFGEVEERFPHAGAQYTERSTSITGTYVPSRDLFFFIAANDPLSMTAAFIDTSSTASPLEIRVPNAVLAGAADRVGVVALDTASLTAVPAMITFTRQGVLRTARVDDAITQPFTVFTASTAGTPGVSFDRATIARNGPGEMMLGYRRVSATGPELVLERNATTTNPAGFSQLTAMTRPRVGPNFEIVSVSNGGGLDDFIVVYEEEDAMGRISDIRILGANNYGIKDGYRPFVEDLTGDWRLEDVGLVYHGNTVWLAVLATHIYVGNEARYTEVPLEVLDYPDTRRGEHPGVVIDSSTLVAHGRIGCKQQVMEDCPIVWLGTGARFLFIRR